MSNVVRVMYYGAYSREVVGVPYFNSGRDRIDEGDCVTEGKENDGWINFHQDPEHLLGSGIPCRSNCQWESLI